MLVKIVTLMLILTVNAIPVEILNDDLEQSGSGPIDTVHIDRTANLQKIGDDILTKLSTKQDLERGDPRPVAVFSPSDLQNDINDFIELVPADDVKAKFEEYYRNDMDMQHIHEYLNGKEFYELRKYILDMHDVKELLQYLTQNGFNVKNILRKIDHRLGITKVKPPVQATVSSYHSQQTLLGEFGFSPLE